ncbi:hypothetical protein ABDB91_04255 [Desulfoscipio sp. XC116]|uniref:hypothetical protein n=1 Tax=Desulfoscipio sp. XC116 TaxID=3144975 RepID=UPI00325B862F
MKRTSIISILVIMAFAMMGFGFAMWSDTVAISASAQAGDLKFHYVSGTADSKDIGGDWTCDYGLGNVCVTPEGKDVGSTATSMEDTNGDGFQDKINVAVNNAYPCYFNDISWWVESTGSIPIIIQGAKLTWGGAEYDIKSGRLYILCQDRDNGTYNLFEVPGGQMGRLADYYEEVDGMIELKWGDNVGLQLHPHESVEQSFTFHVVQPARQDTTYNFGLSIQGIQWNESPIPGHRP